jgi:hypothetical protein
MKNKRSMFLSSSFIISVTLLSTIFLRWHNSTVASRLLVQKRSSASSSPLSYPKSLPPSWQLFCSAKELGGLSIIDPGTQGNTFQFRHAQNMLSNMPGFGCQVMLSALWLSFFK